MWFIPCRMATLGPAIKLRLTLLHRIHLLISASWLWQKWGTTGEVNTKEKKIKILLELLNMFFLFGFDDQKISFMLKRLVCISIPLIIHHNGLSFGGAWGRSKYRWPKCEHLYKSRSNWNHAFLFGIIFPCKGFQVSLDWLDRAGRPGYACYFRFKGPGWSDDIHQPASMLDPLLRGEKWRGNAHIFQGLGMEIHAVFILELSHCLWKSHVNNILEIHGSTFFYTFTHCVCVVDIGRVQFMGLFTDGIMMNRCHCLR